MLMNHLHCLQLENIDRLLELHEAGVACVMSRIFLVVTSHNLKRLSQSWEDHGKIMTTTCIDQMCQNKLKMGKGDHELCANLNSGDLRKQGPMTLLSNIRSCSIPQGLCPSLAVVRVSHSTTSFRKRLGYRLTSL